jgi:hypothetical protein
MRFAKRRTDVGVGLTTSSDRQLTLAPKRDFLISVGDIHVWR